MVPVRPPPDRQSLLAARAATVRSRRTPILLVACPRFEPSRRPTGHGRSWLIAPERAGACKNLQDFPKHASTIGFQRPCCVTADPDLPGSAAFDRECLLPVTTEAAGSSPVDPAKLSLRSNVLALSKHLCSTHTATCTGSSASFLTDS